MRRASIVLVRCALALSGALLAAAAHAQQRAPAAAPEHAGYSSYERATLERALARLGATLDPAPEGKIVEGIDVVPFEVIEDRDPAPGFLNWFHALSRPYVIRREVLLSVGRPYEQALADESARVLRGLNQLSLVLVFAVRGSAPDRVRVAVATKDVWSLRLNSNYRFAGGNLEYLFLQPAETNLLGVHHAIAAQIELDPGALSLGVAYAMPRVGGSRVRLRTELNAIIGRETGALEGSSGEFVYGQPLYATEAEWAWEAEITWRDEVTRRFIGTRLATFDAAATPADDRIPYRYRSDLLVGGYTVTRSFGGRGAAAASGVKHDVSLGIEASRKVYRVGELAGFAPSALAEFERREMPVSDTRVAPVLKYSTYSTRFSRVLDFNTLALQEDYRLGHELSIAIYPVTTALNSTRSFLGVRAAAAYTVALGDGLARAVVETVTELDRSQIFDASVEARARVHTPSFGVGRLVFDVRLFDRYRNYLNRRSQLGGDTRLRGYPTGAFLGEDVLSANLELRTRPLEIWSCQIAGAAFFDAGDAFDGHDDMRLKQSAGFGVRALFPQLNRIVMRADWGFPLTRGYREPDSLPGDIVVTFGQAFPMLPADE
ncbi:hypothetical protein BE08_07560 [Sorangium cellulosum]|uniref:Bacterial surface antigen (D15) domain-containing protein n=1 Tax=Sorangium cellulosum TaxID=56 RepID=A0A150P3W1_SORCE|nr:hypothetical protein BE08_07560 [Sorangium cellulosum]